MGSSYRTQMVLQIVGLCAFVLYHIGFIALGSAALVRDHPIREDVCGKSTHVWKYALLNTLFSGMTLITYAAFPGGGEGARARALMITILHASFLIWSGLMTVKLPECFGADSSLQTEFNSMNIFVVVCGWHNCCFFLAYLLHELYLGSTFEADFTLMPEVEKLEQYDYSYTGAMVAQHQINGNAQGHANGHANDTVLKVVESSSEAQSSSIEHPAKFIGGTQEQSLKANQVLRQDSPPRMRDSSPQQSDTPTRAL